MRNEKCLPQRGKGDQLCWWMRCCIQVCTYICCKAIEFAYGKNEP